MLVSRVSKGTNKVRESTESTSKMVA